MKDNGRKKQTAQAVPENLLPRLKSRSWKWPHANQVAVLGLARGDQIEDEVAPNPQVYIDPPEGLP